MKIIPQIPHSSLDLHTLSVAPLSCNYFDKKKYTFNFPKWHPLTNSSGQLKLIYAIADISPQYFSLNFLHNNFNFSPAAR
jgi:hypothetical protein